MSKEIKYYHELYYKLFLDGFSGGVYLVESQSFLLTTPKTSLRSSRLISDPQ